MNGARTPLSALHGDPEGVTQLVSDHHSTITDLTHARPGSYRELIAIAWPLVLSSGTQAIQHIVDRILLTWYSQEAMAASLPAGIFFWSALSLPFGTVMYVNSFVAQYEGAERRDRVMASVWQGVYLAVVAGLLLGALAPLSGWLFELVAHGDALMKHEVDYFFWLMIGSLPALLSAGLSTFFSGRGQTNLVLAVSASSVAINIVLDIVMIFGWGSFPALGISGAAIATGCANIFAAMIYVALLSRRVVVATYGTWSNWRFEPELFRRLLRFGLPNGLQMFLDVAGFNIFMVVIGWIGPRELAATNIAFNLNTLAFIPVLGIGIAVSTLVGQRIGEGDPAVAEQSVGKGVNLAMLYMAAWAVVYIALPDLLLLPYGWKTANPEEFAATRQTVIVLLRFVAFYSLSDAMAIVYGAAIRAAGDTRFSLAVTVLCSTLLLVTPVTLIAWLWEPSLFWSWVWCCAYVVGMGLCFWLRFRQGVWKTMRVIEAEPAATETDGDRTDWAGKPRSQAEVLPLSE